jgi:hypothetical protein
MWIDLRNFDEKEIRNTVTSRRLFGTARDEGRSTSQAEAKAEAEASGGRPGSSSSTITNSILEYGRRGSWVVGRGMHHHLLTLLCTQAFVGTVVLPVYQPRSLHMYIQYAEPQNQQLARTA